MTTKHTPAPWHTNGKSIFSGDYLIITTVNNEVFTQETNEANAVLIATAPELFAALHEIILAADAGELDQYGTSVDWFREARAAINKATGQEI
jgi:hypothetical protein